MLKTIWIQLQLSQLLAKHAYTPFSPLAIPWTSVRFSSWAKGDAKNPWLRILESVCSPHICMYKVALNHSPKQSEKVLQNKR